MTWTKISDDHFDKEEIFALSRSAALLDVEAKVWCNRLLNDGRVPAAQLGRFTTSTEPLADAAELVAAGVWVATDCGWQVDWTDQRTSDQVRADREANQAKQSAYRDRVKRHAAGDHGACHPKHCPALAQVSNPVTASVTNSGSNAYLTCPDPDLSRPVPKGQGQGQEADAATASPRRQPTEHTPANGIDAWTQGGDCEHQASGLDRSRGRNALRCPTCAKHERAQALLAERRQTT